jgi:hypothetical protein
LPKEKNLFYNEVSYVFLSTDNQWRFNLKPIKITLATLLVAALVLVGCSQQVTPDQTTEMQTAIAATLSVMQTQISINASQPATAAETIVATEAATLAPTATAAPTEAPSATVQPTIVVPVSNSQATSAPSLRVGDVEDTNYPDGTYVNVNMTFTKIWHIRNVGTATWPADTKIVAVDDNPFSASDTVIGQVVSNGQSVELKIDLKAPESAANYKAKFMLETPDGTRFGVGPNFDQPFWILIYVR